jgi:CheY-like chemotaxis protein
MKTICIVDDYDINLFIIEEYLNKSYKTFSFCNAQDCIEYIKNNKVDLVLMDCNMPIMDGFTASKIIKKMNPDIKIVAVTANSFEMDIKKCYESGMDDVLVKPVLQERLLKTIKIFQE